MAGKPSYDKELKSIIEYLKSDENEDAKKPLLYPLFQKLFGDKFKILSAAGGADVYIEGKIIVEGKTRASSWLQGFYQALHYHKKCGFVYSIIIVISNKLVGIWKVNKNPWN